MGEWEGEPIISTTAKKRDQLNIFPKKLNPDSFLRVILGKPVCTSGDRRRQKDRSRCRDRLNNMVFIKKLIIGWTIVNGKL